MLQFKNTTDLKQLPKAHPAYSIIKDLVERLILDYNPLGRAYAPDDDGWIALIEEQDMDRVLTEIWQDWKLSDVEWEGMACRDGTWQAIYVSDNEKGFVIIIPDEPWITAELRENIAFYSDLLIPSRTSAGVSICGKILGSPPGG